jgi:hypothetical protein
MQPGGAGPDVASPGRSFVRWFARHVGLGSERASLPAWLPAHANVVLGCFRHKHPETRLGVGILEPKVVFRWCKS